MEIVIARTRGLDPRGRGDPGVAAIHESRAPYVPLDCFGSRLAMTALVPSNHSTLSVLNPMK